MSEVLLSVIIPAYHSEATIKETIESIYREFESEINYEIIVVENGPEDQTTQVLEKLMCKGIPIKLFHSKQGVSNARNVGIARASGTWLMFADADDTLHPGCGKRVIEVMQTSEADLCLFGHQSGRNSRPVCDQAEICKEGSIERARIRMLQAPTKYMQVWAKLFRRHQILASGVLFEPELHLAEDSDFTFQYTAFCRSAAFYPDIIYDYHINPVSVMHIFDKKKVEGYIRAMEVMTDRISEEKDAIQQACRQYILVHFHIAMVNGIFAGNDTDSFFNKVSEIRQTGKRPVFAKAIRQVSLRSGGWIAGGMNFLLKGHMYGALGLVYTFRVWQKKRSYRWSVNGRQVKN